MIEVHVPTSRFSLPYYKYLIKNFSELAHKPQDLQFVAHFMDGNTLDVPGKFVCGAYGAGSVGHGFTLNSIVRLPQTCDIKIIADADTVMLKRGWDSILTDKMQAYDCIGVPYEDIGGFSSGVINVQTYKQVPSAVWFAMSNRRNFSELDFSSSKESTLVITSDIESSVYNLPVGYELLRDVGWRIPMFLHDNAISYLTLHHVQFTSKHSIALKNLSDYNEEYLLEGAPFIGHQRGSMKHPFRQHPLSSAFYDAVEDYVKSI